MSQDVKQPGEFFRKHTPQVMAGLIFLVPLLIAGWVMVKVLQIGAFGYHLMFQRWIPQDLDPWILVPLENFVFPTLVLLLFVFGAWFIGGMLKRETTSRLLHFWPWMLDRLPGVNRVYRMVKDAVDMMFGDAAKSVLGTCWVQYGSPGTWGLAKITHDQGSIVVVYLPTSPNPTSGFTLAVPKSMIVPSSLRTEAVMEYCVKMGTNLPPEIQAELSRLPESLPAAHDRRLSALVEQIAERTGVDPSGLD